MPKSKQPQAILQPKERISHKINLECTRQGCNEDLELQWEGPQ